MDLLIDTCAFIWWGQRRERPQFHCQIHHEQPSQPVAPELRIHLGDATQASKRKTRLQKPLEEIINDQCGQNGLKLLPIEPRHIYGLDLLPFHHHDPFDRVIISQARISSFSIVTDDDALANMVFQLSGKPVQRFHPAYFFAAGF